MQSVHHRARFLVLILLTVVLSSAFVSLNYVYSRPYASDIKYLVNSVMQQAWDDLFATDYESTAATTTYTNEPINDTDQTQYSNTQEEIDTQVQIEQPKAVYKQSAPARDCFKYTVPHLDGSSSTLCYSQSDYNQLVSLGYNYSSAKTFYEFHLDGVQDYQAQYEQTGSDIYLDAKASQQREADQSKQKMDAAVGSMQEIEKRGY